jgi:hypothetical protein
MEELAEHFLRLLQCARRHPVMSSGLSLQTVADEIEVFRRRSDRKDQFESQCLNVNVTPPLSKQAVTRSWPKSIADIFTSPAGHEPFLLKPLDPEQVEEAVNRLMAYLAVGSS